MPTTEEMRETYANTKTNAVVGASSDRHKSAHSIPAYLQGQGFRILPVSPRGGEILGENVATSLTDINEPVDVVNTPEAAEGAPDFVRNRIDMQSEYLRQIEKDFGDMVRAVLPLYDDEIRGVESLKRASENLYA